MCDKTQYHDRDHKFEKKFTIRPMTQKYSYMAQGNMCNRNTRQTVGLCIRSEYDTEQIMCALCVLHSTTDVKCSTAQFNETKTKTKTTSFKTKTNTTTFKTKTAPFMTKTMTKTHIFGLKTVLRPRLWS